MRSDPAFEAGPGRGSHNPDQGLALLLGVSCWQAHVILPLCACKQATHVVIPRSLGLVMPQMCRRMASARNKVKVELLGMLLLLGHFNTAFNVRIATCWLGRRGQGALARQQ